MKLDTLITARNNNTTLLLSSTPPPLPLPLPTTSTTSPLIIRPARKRNRPQRPPPIRRRGAGIPANARTTIPTPGNTNNATPTGPRKHRDSDPVFRLRVAKGGADLALGPRPDQRCDLGEDIDEGEGGAGAGVEEVDLAVVGAAAGGEEAGLPGREGEGFDGGGVGEGVGLEARAVDEG